MCIKVVVISSNEFLFGKKNHLGGDHINKHRNIWYGFGMIGNHRKRTTPTYSMFVKVDSLENYVFVHYTRILSLQLVYWFFTTFGIVDIKQYSLKYPQT